MATAKALALLQRQGHRRDPRWRHQDDLQDETETDLFGEQAVLCGGTEELARPVST